jgi:hypothetical protein
MWTDTWVQPFWRNLLSSSDLIIISNLQICVTRNRWPLHVSICKRPGVDLKQYLILKMEARIHPVYKGTCRNIFEDHNPDTRIPFSVIYHWICRNTIGVNVYGALRLRHDTFIEPYGKDTSSGKAVTMVKEDTAIWYGEMTPGPRLILQLFQDISGHVTRWIFIVRV